MGTFGDAALFSFQVLKPLNTFGGGMAYTRDRALGERLAAAAAAEPWPAPASVLKRIRTGKLERLFMRPAVFSLTGYPLLRAASAMGARPDVYMWESVRPLEPFPPSYRERYANVQAAVGLAGLDRLEDWTERTRAHARTLSRLAGQPGVVTRPTRRPRASTTSMAYVPDREALVRGALRPDSTSSRTT